MMCGWLWRCVKFIEEFWPEFSKNPGVSMVKLRWLLA